LAQAYAQAFFQITHMQADGRTGDAQRTFGSGKTAVFGNSLEDPDKTQVEITHLSEWGNLHRVSFSVCIVQKN
jgi:hypothetical protein